MNDYIFDIGLPDGEVLRDIVSAASRFIGETIIAERYPEAVSVKFIDVH